MSGGLRKNHYEVLGVPQDATAAAIKVTLTSQTASERFVMVSVAHFVCFSGSLYCCSHLLFRIAVRYSTEVQLAPVVCLTGARHTRPAFPHRPPVYAKPL